MLRLGEDMEAEDALEERRVTEGDDAVPLVAELEPNRDVSTLRLHPEPEAQRSSLGRIS
jgi:hypothetical protein